MSFRHTTTTNDPRHLQRTDRARFRMIPCSTFRHVHPADQCMMWCDSGDDCDYLAIARAHRNWDWCAHGRLGLTYTFRGCHWWAVHVPTCIVWCLPMVGHARNRNPIAGWRPTDVLPIPVRQTCFSSRERQFSIIWLLSLVVSNN